MLLIEMFPENADLAKYVDRYQLFIFTKPAIFKTIPNGKIECYLIKEGGFIKWDFDSESFISSSKSGILPATDKASLYHIPSHITCLNIKFNLNIVGLSLYNKLLTNWKDFNTAKIIPEIDQEHFFNLIDEENPSIDVAGLDRVIQNSLNNQVVNNRIDFLLKLVQDQSSRKFRVIDLAKSLNMTQKSTERWIRKQFNLTPKKLLQIIRFEQVSNSLKNQSSLELVDSLKFGYYDQSHFIKECQNISGYSPKEFFSKMKLSTNDIIFE